jgi:2-oxoglutarate dehydrogenase complex dehydrogenase (E1) component-like enzyme
MVQAPVMHVNGDDPEAVVKCIEIAIRYRQQFNSDVFIDMVCYRRHGHNEGDDPKFTQPMLYSLIEKHPNPRENYVAQLQSNSNPEIQDMSKDMEKKFWSDLQERLDEVKQYQDNTFTRKDICSILHKQISDDLTEIKTDLKVLIKNGTTISVVLVLDIN